MDFERAFAQEEQTARHPEHDLRAELLAQLIDPLADQDRHQSGRAGGHNQAQSRQHDRAHVGAEEARHAGHQLPIGIAAVVGFFFEAGEETHLSPCTG